MCEWWRAELEQATEGRETRRHKEDTMMKADRVVCNSLELAL